MRSLKDMHQEKLLRISSLIWMTAASEPPAVMNSTKTASTAYCEISDISVIISTKVKRHLVECPESLMTIYSSVHRIFWIRINRHQGEHTGKVNICLPLSSFAVIAMHRWQVFVEPVIPKGSIIITFAAMRKLKNATALWFQNRLLKTPLLVHALLS